MHYSLKISWSDWQNGYIVVRLPAAKSIQLNLGHDRLKKAIREWVEREIIRLNIRNVQGQRPVLPAKFFLYAVHSDVNGAEYYVEAPSYNIVNTFHHFAR